MSERASDGGMPCGEEKSSAGGRLRGTNDWSASVDGAEGRWREEGRQGRELGADGRPRESI